MLSTPRIRVCLSFPYSSTDPAVFEKFCEVLKSVAALKRPLNTSARKAALVLNMDTVDRGGYDAFLRYLADRQWAGLADTYDLYKIRATDTCQMWLHGWDNILRESDAAQDRDDCILQLPGDLREVRGEFKDFIDRLRTLALKVHDADLVVGDFETLPFGSKALIDTYGTFPLLLTWFPDVATELREQFRIGRPRSEFLAVSIPFLRAMMKRRKFAYEQTLAFLIYAVELPTFGDPPSGSWRVDKAEMGVISDSSEHRDFKEAMGQIERTERMLRMLWREMNSDAAGAFTVDKFERLDQRSTAMREAAMIIFENYLTASRRGRGDARGAGPVAARHHA